MSKTHEVKIKHKYAIQHLGGLKPWELRKNDRDYQVNDVVFFEVIDESGSSKGFSYKRKIKHLYEGTEYGLKKGFCIMTLEIIR